MKILVTGAAGFIGSFVARYLAHRGDEVIGLDSINDYYDVRLKYARLHKLSGLNCRGGGQIQESISYNKLLQSNIYPNYKFIKLQLEDTQNLAYLFKTQEFDVVCNLAAQAGVRYSLKSPRAYIDSNIIGFLNILESCRHNNVKHLVYASSSSVYGLNQDMPFSTHKSADHPISLYATSKKSNELMAHTYSHLFHLPTTGLRFFTVYGPWGRPDMALFQFTKNILENKSIDVFNEGNMARDFTYIDDIVEGVVRVIDNVPKPNPKWDTHKADSSSSSAPYKIYNIGNSAPVKLMDFIAEIENNIGKKAKKNFLPLQEGDVLATFADVSDLQNDLFYQPSTSISTGIAHFVRWYREYYKC